MSLKIGLVGCGNISSIYLDNAALFRDIAFTACADIDAAAAERQARRFAIEARSVNALLRSDDVDIVLNLTIPEAHAEVSLAAIEAGKHVYTEKPLATTLPDGLAVVAAANAKGLRVGAAPDTVLGASLQEARALIDSGAVGRPLTGLAAILGHGMEHWHPNPGFFFRPGGGPVFDMGPYYLTALVTLLGPVASVQAAGQIGFAERTVTTPGSAMLGRTIRVETLTSVQGLLEFASGAQVTFLASWDVWRHGVPPIELYGETGSLRRARSQLVRRRSENRARPRRLANHRDPGPDVRRRQLAEGQAETRELSRIGTSRHGARHPGPAAAPRQRRDRTACPGRDGGPADRRDRAARRDDRTGLRAAGAARRTGGHGIVEIAPG